MRRIIITVTAVAVLGAAAAALAAAQFNTYTTTMSFKPSKAGSKTSPSPIGFTQVFTAAGTKGNRAAPLTDLKTTLYGVVYLGKDFPKCSITTIANNKNDTKHGDQASGPCPNGALIATANVDALLGPASDPSASSHSITPCHPGLDVWNEGHGKLVYFFWSTTAQGSAHYCGGVKTGTTPPYEGTIKKSGPNLVIDVPLPASVSSKVLGSATWGSLIKETITYKKLSIKVHGKNEPFFASVACKSGKRPWTQKFTADFTSADESTNNYQSASKTGKAKC